MSISLSNLLFYYRMLKLCYKFYKPDIFVRLILHFHLSFCYFCRYYISDLQKLPISMLELPILIEMPFMYIWIFGPFIWNLLHVL